MLAIVMRMSPADLELLHRLRALLIADRGFTVDLHRGQPVRRGVAVCAVPDRTLICSMADWCDEQILDWVLGSRRFAERHRRTDLHLGGWCPTHGDEVHLDIVRVVPCDRQGLAFALGRLHRQLAAFDLTRCSLVELVT
jgi:hypothetical protein